MSKTLEMVVSVRIPDEDLRKMRFLSRALDLSVGQLIRDAVGKHVEELLGNSEIRERAIKMQREQDKMLQQLLKPGKKTRNQRKS